MVNQPLSHLFNEKKQIPVLASARIQRWALTLSTYTYSIRYKAGKSLNNADALSRLPRSQTTECPSPADLVQLVNHLSSTATTAGNIKIWTDRDPILSQVRKLTQDGWPSTSNNQDMKPYFNRRHELSLLQGCVLWGARVIVPIQGRQKVLEELHDTHPGVSKMKA